MQFNTKKITSKEQIQSTNSYEQGCLSKFEIKENYFSETGRFWADDIASWKFVARRCIGESATHRFAKK